MLSLAEQCIALRKKDRTISEIVRLTGAHKSSVYYHIRHIPLSLEKRAAIRKASGRRARNIANARKGKSSRRFIPFDAWTSDMVSLVAHFIFDGDIDDRGCNYNNRSTALHSHVQRCMETIYAYPPTLYTNTLTGVVRTSYFNVALAAYMSRRAKELLDDIASSNKELQRSFLKAFFDDEGCMDFRPARNLRRIRGYQKDVRVLKIVQKLLAQFDIPARIELPNEVTVVGKDALIRFERMIGFSPGVCINGQRSNSTWKQSLEKRELLRRAIASYQH